MISSPVSFHSLRWSSLALCSFVHPHGKRRQSVSVGSFVHGVGRQQKLFVASFNQIVCLLISVASNSRCGIKKLSEWLLLGGDKML
jgi:hypothetical protein